MTLGISNEWTLHNHSNCTIHLRLRKAKVEEILPHPTLQSSITPPFINSTIAWTRKLDLSPQHCGSCAASVIQVGDQLSYNNTSGLESFFICVLTWDFYSLLVLLLCCSCTALFSPSLWQGSLLYYVSLRMSSVATLHPL